MSVNIYSMLSFVGFIILFAVSTITDAKEQPYSLNVKILLRILGMWLFFEMLYYAFPGRRVQLTFDALRYVAIVFVPLSVFLTTHKFLYNRDLNHKLHVFILMFPLLTLAVSFTDSLHHWFYDSRYIDIENGLHYVRSHYGPFYKHVFLPYCYITLGLALALAIRAAFVFRANKRKQAITIIIALLVPTLGNASYIYLDTFSKAVDYTPILFLVTGILFYVSIRRFGFLNIVPFAQEIVLDNMADAMIILDGEDHIIDMNSSANKIFKNLDIRSNPDMTLLECLETASFELTNFRKVSYDKATISVRTAEGDKHYYMRDQTIYDKKNQMLGRILLLHDITELRETMSMLEAEKKRAEEATLAKSRFVANISHEIRTPMTAIIGMTDMLGTTSDKAQSDNLIRNIQTSTRLLLQIVNDLLDLSKMEADQLKLEYKPFEFMSALNETLAIIQPMLQNRPIELKTDFDEHMPRYLVGDALRLKQIFINLLSNAAKYTEDGQIIFAAKVDGFEDNKVHLHIRVCDSGIGISEDDQRHLFDLFYQAEHTNTRRFTGSGLGLSIAKQLIDQMQGKIQVDSVLGKGSSFTITLSLDYLQDSREQTTDDGKYDLSKMHVLVAEDNLMNQEYMKLIFKKMGCTFDFANNGEVAVEKALSGTYDIILMDIQMPLLDGHDAAQIIRKTEADRYTQTDGSKPPRPVSIVALTANDTPEDRMQATLAGMDGFLSKPFTYKKLVEVIEGLDLFKLLEI